MRTALLLAMMFAALAVTACGGGDDGDATATPFGGASGAPTDDAGSEPTLEADVTPPPGGIEGDTHELRLSVNTGGSVDYFLASGEMQVCPSQCVAEFPDTFQARIQRERNLSDEQEAQYNLVGWGGDCAQVDAVAEPRGGICVLDMDGDKEVSVEFEQRWRLTIRFAGQSSTARYTLAYEPRTQKGGNPYAGAGQVDCAVPCPRDPHVNYYDTGTVVTITLGDPNQSSFSGDCAGTADCVLTMDDDKDVVVNWTQ